MMYRPMLVDFNLVVYFSVISETTKFTCHMPNLVQMIPSRLSLHEIEFIKWCFHCLQYPFISILLIV